ncbi:MAG: 50S ribosomal protein L18 [Rickettsiaceae bacterium H1]|nr:50S ribosomal protein L18 [Rickettsiaceae bacterium H1]
MVEVKLKNSKRRALRVRSRIKSKDKLRISLFKSNRHLYAQLISDVDGKTLAHASTLSPEIKSVMNRKLNKEAAKALGELFFKKCNGVLKLPVILDRGSYSYTGIISEFANVLRGLGLKI